jgi:hypothetical protein
MPPMLDIEHSSHLMPSRPIVDSVDDEGIDDNCTFADVMKGKKAKASQEDQSSPSGDSLPSHPKGLRAVTRKRKASIISGGDEDETSRYVPCLVLLAVNGLD